MKTSLRILLGVSALALLITAAPVMAAEVDHTTDISRTGADSDVDVDNDLDINHDVDVDNDGDVDNDADVDCDTGDNEQNENTTGGDQESGVCEATGEWENIINAMAGAVGANDDGLEYTTDTTVELTGADSDVDVDNNVDVDIDIDLNNMADIMNDLDFDADTGDNRMNRNTTGGDQESGAASLVVLFANWANNDASWASAHAGEIVADFTTEISRTGADSDVNVDNNLDVDFDVDIDNDADIDNDVDVDINTGGNRMNRNTTGGNQRSGDADVVVELENSANNGGNSAAAGGGSVEFTTDTTVELTGADSDVDVNNNVDVDHDVNINNDADINNDVNVDADTGSNEQNRNTEGGSQTSGDVRIELNISNEVNS